MKKVVDYKSRKNLDKKVNTFKNLLVGCYPIITKDDFLKVGMIAILAGMKIFKEFAKFDSQSAQEFEETKTFFSIFLQKQIYSIQKMEFKGIVKTQKSGGTND